MTIYLLRHGLAAEQDPAIYPRDFERPLTSKGERKLREIGNAMKGFELSFDRILSSPYVRARQTAEIVAGILHERKRLEFSDALKPSGTSKEVVENLKTQSPAPESVLLVGHEPNLSQFISFLLTGDSAFFCAYEERRALQAVHRIASGGPLRDIGVAFDAKADGYDGEMI